MNKILKGFLGGSSPVILLWILVYVIRPTDPYGYGMAILPLILISIVLFIIGFIIGYNSKLNFNSKKR